MKRRVAVQVEPEPRPLPVGITVAAAVTDIFDALAVALGDTRGDAGIGCSGGPSISSTAPPAGSNTIMRGKEQGQRRMQREQDGSEVKSVETGRLTAEGQTLIEQKNVTGRSRELAAEAFETHIGSACAKRNVPMANHRHLTAAMIDSRNFLAAKRRAETGVIGPPV